MPWSFLICAGYEEIRPGSSQNLSQEQRRPEVLGAWQGGGSGAERWGSGGPLGQQVGKGSAQLRIALRRSKVPGPDPAGQGGSGHWAEHRIELGPCSQNGAAQWEGERSAHHVWGRSLSPEDAQIWRRLGGWQCRRMLERTWYQVLKNILLTSIWVLQACFSIRA